MRTDSLIDLILNRTTCSFCIFHTYEYVEKELNGVKYRCHCDLQNHPEKYDKLANCMDGIIAELNKEVEE